MIHVSIPPFLTYVRSEYLYSLKEGYGYFTPATVFAISGNAADSLKFQIITENNILFKEIPVCALSNDRTAPKLSEEECVATNCPDNELFVVEYDYLSTLRICGIWKKNFTFWQKGSYIFTIEWPKNKLSLHLIELNDGNYVLWNNENITWGEEIPQDFPKFNA